MKIFLFGFTFWTLFLLGCTTDHPEPLPSPTAVLPTTISEPTLMAIGTAVQTAPLTASSSPIPTLPPPPEGQIIFLWDSESLPLEYGGEQNHTLYLAQPSESSINWEIRPLLNDLFGFPAVALSHDQTKLALTLIEDMDNDGLATQESVNRGFDGYNLYVYTLPTAMFQRLPLEILNPYNPGWLPDNQTTIYRGSDTVYALNIDGSPPRQLANFPQHIEWITPSPDGSLIAVNSSGEISFIDMATGEVLPVTGKVSGVAVEPTWSPDSHWLTLNHMVTDQLLLINTETREVHTQEDIAAVTFASWSPDSQRLLLVKNETEGSALSLLSPNDLLSSTLIEIQTPIVTVPVWSPDGTQIALAFSDQELIKLAVLETTTGDIYELWQGTNVDEVHISGWSPEGAWLVFFVAKPPNHSEINVIHHQGGAAYPLLVTEETYEPRSVMWLP